MALKYTRKITDKVELKGVLNKDATTVTYEVKEDGVVYTKTATIQDYLNQFVDASLVTITIQSNSEAPLSLENNEYSEKEMLDYTE